MSMQNPFDPSSIQLPEILVNRVKELKALCDKTVAQQDEPPEIQQQNLDAVEKAKVDFKNLLAIECNENSEIKRAFLEVLTLATYEVDKLATRQGFGTAKMFFATPTPFDS